MENKIIVTYKSHIQYITFIYILHIHIHTHTHKRERDKNVFKINISRSLLEIGKFQIIFKLKSTQHCEQQQQHSQ